MAASSNKFKHRSAKSPSENNLACQLKRHSYEIPAANGFKQQEEGHEILKSNEFITFVSYGLITCSSTIHTLLESSSVSRYVLHRSCNPGIIYFLALYNTDKDIFSI